MSEQMRRRALLPARIRAVGLVGLALLTACGGSGGSAAEQVPLESGGISGLKGLWHLTAEGEPEGTVLSLQGAELKIGRPCVILKGTWAAREHVFIGELDRGGQEPWVANPACPASQQDKPAWLSRAAHYLADGTSWHILDRDAVRVATLTPGATWPKALTGPTFFLESTGSWFYPTLEERAQLNDMPAVPLPAGVRAPTVADLIGRWEQDLKPNWQCDQPYVEFRSDGRWVGHDSGDDSKGRWVLGYDGIALGTAGYDDAGGCASQVGFPPPEWEGTFVDVWFLRLGRLGLDGRELVFYDPSGVELARAHRA